MGVERNTEEILHSAGNMSERSSGATVRTLAAIWADILHVDRVDVEVTDNFLELGGDSILALQVLWRTKEAFGKDIPLQAVFAATLGDLARLIDGEATGPTTTPPE